MFDHSLKVMLDGVDSGKMTPFEQPTRAIIADIAENWDNYKVVKKAGLDAAYHIFTITDSGHGVEFVIYANLVWGEDRGRKAVRRWQYTCSSHDSIGNREAKGIVGAALMCLESEEKDRKAVQRWQLANIYLGEGHDRNSV